MLQMEWNNSKRDTYISNTGVVLGIAESLSWAFQVCLLFSTEIHINWL